MPSTWARSRAPAMAVGATYFDGNSARPHAVELRIDGAYMKILDQAGAALARWPLDDVRLVDKPSASETPRLRRMGGGDDRLTLASDIDLDWLESQCPHLHRPAREAGNARRSLLLWGCAAVASLAVLVIVLLPRFASNVAAIVPEPVMERLGTTTENQIIDLVRTLNGQSADRNPRCTGSAGSTAIDALIDRLTRELDRPVAVTVTVIDSPIVNALALPGGRIIIFRGMIDAAAKQAARDGPEVLAGILAHEIGHVLRRDALALTIENAGLAVIASLIIGDAAGGVIAAALGRSMLGAAHAREAERRADATAISLLNRAGIRGRPIAAFLGQAAKDDNWSLLSTHPGGAKRTAEIQRAVTGHGTAMSAADWSAIRRICAE